MTAPAVSAPSAPASAPSAPTSVPTAPLSSPGSGEAGMTPGSVREAISRVANKTGIAADAPAAAEPSVKFVRDQDAPAQSQEMASDTLDVADDQGGMANLGSESDGQVPDSNTLAEPVSEMSMEDGSIILRAERNADGTYKTKMDPKAKLELVIKDPETGENRVYHKTLPELTRMARDGIWGQKVRGEVSYYRDNLPAWQQQHQELQSNHKITAELARELLTAPEEVVIARREEFAASQSPERRLAELEHQLRQKAEQQMQAQQQQQQAVQANAFLTTRIAPVVTQAEQTLGVDRVAGKIARDTMALTVNGKIPPQNWQKLDHYFQNHFASWAKQEIGKVQRQSKQQEQAVRQSQAVVNNATRAIAPVGRAAADTPPKQAAPTNVRNAIDRLVNRPLPSGF